MKTLTLFLLFAGVLNAEPAGATDLVPRADSPASEKLKIKEEPKTTVTLQEAPSFMDQPPLNTNIIDIGALEKRVVALEAEVANLKKQNEALTEIRKKEETSIERRKKAVAEEVRRRKAIRDSAQTTEPNQTLEPTTMAVTPPAAQESRQP